MLASASATCAALAYLYGQINNNRREAKEGDEEVKAAFGRALDRMDLNERERRRENLEEVRSIYAKMDSAREISSRQHEIMLDRLDTLGRVVVTLPTRDEVRKDRQEMETRLMESINQRLAQLKER